MCVCKDSCITLAVYYEVLVFISCCVKIEMEVSKMHVYLYKHCAMSPQIPTPHHCYVYERTRKSRKLHVIFSQPLSVFIETVDFKQCKQQQLTTLHSKINGISTTGVQHL